MNAKSRVRWGLALTICIIGAATDIVGPSRAGAYCTGDCNGSGTVASSEFADCRGIAFGSRPLSVCPACDCDENGVVSMAEWMRAEQNVLSGCSARECPAASATPGVSVTSTPTRTVAVPASTRTLTRTALPTPTGTPAVPPTTSTSSTPSTEPTPTVPRLACVGDCDASGSVAVNEVVLGVNLALERAEVGACEAFDPNRTSTVSVNELVRGVNNLLAGCGS
jgi:hypothetical protein